jgi:hypothetical protein
VTLSYRRRRLTAKSTLRRMIRDDGAPVNLGKESQSMKNYPELDFDSDVPLELYPLLDEPPVTNRDDADASSNALRLNSEI